MDRMTFMKNYWRYYILLEKKFIGTLNYVELAEANFSTYSVEYAHQLLAVGSELDTFFKIYCGFSLDERRKNIIDYTRHIMSEYPEITSQSVEIYNTAIKLTPYEEWTRWNQQDSKSKNLLSWWDSYNLVKHNRQENITKASMGNVVTALAALHLIEMKYLQVITKEAHEVDEPDTDSELFHLTGWQFNLSAVDDMLNNVFNK